MKCRRQAKKRTRKLPPQTAQFNDKEAAIRHALTTTEYSSHSTVSIRATHLFTPSNEEEPNAITSDEVAMELKRIQRKAADERSPEEVDIHEVWVEGGAKLRSLGTWVDKEIHVVSFNDSTNLRILLLIRVYSSSIQDAGSIEPYAHAVLVPDAVARSIEGYASKGRASSFKDMATNTYNALTLIDETAPSEGYKLVLAGEEKPIGCVQVKFELADGKKGGHRTCLAKAATGLNKAISATSTPLVNEESSSTKRQRVG